MPHNLTEFKALLLTRKSDLLASIQSKPVSLEEEETSGDSADQAASMADRDFELKFKNRARENLGQIDAALRRIETGEFGICESCGESISEARMRAFLFTTLCIDCKAELESEEQRNHGRTS